MRFLQKLTMVTTALLFSVQLFGQVPNFDSFKPLAEEFAKSISGNLPFVATMGANWSDAYIGQLFPSVPPHFGVGLTTGFALVAKDSINNITSSFGLTLPDLLKNYGLPLPLLVADSRVGGIILPFDLGIKIGFLPQFVSDLVPDVSLNYFAFGVDVRYPILQENVVLPGLSVGAGYSYLTTSARMKIGQALTLNNVPYNKSGNNYTDGSLTLSQPELGVAWNASVIDLKVHLSKNLLILTPYVGLGASLALADASAGYYSTLSLTRPSGGPLDTISGQAAVDSIKATGFNQFDLSADGFESKSPVNGWGFRVYGGSSINLLFFRLDLKALWNINTGALGLELGTRFQL